MLIQLMLLCDYYQSALNALPMRTEPAEDMEVCEDMPVDLEMINMRKRHCMDGMLDHPLNKRTCHGLHSVTDRNGILLNPLADCDMAYWQMEVSSGRIEPMNGFAAKKMVQPACMPSQNHQNVVPPLICPRCVAGESGHISHILKV